MMNLENIEPMIFSLTSTVNDELGEQEPMIFSLTSTVNDELGEHKAHDLQLNEYSQ